jgi:SAM-dependent methyltransferase
MPIPTNLEVRKKVFKQAHSLDAELIELARRDPQHGFLTNPSALLIYTYLVEYIRVFSNEWFNGRPLRILDWGAGKGHITYLLKKHYQGQADVVSCDVAPEELARHDSSFRQATPIIDHTNIKVVPLHHPFQLPFAYESFDVVISMGVLEHVPHDQRSLHEIQRILCPRGLFFCFFLPYRWSWTQQLAHWRGDYYHDRLYDQPQVQRMLTAANFKLIDSWHRQLLPKNSVRYPVYREVEQVDQWLCNYTPLRHLATNIEFVAYKS